MSDIITSATGQSTVNPLTHEITILSRAAWNGWSPSGIQPEDEVLLARGGITKRAFDVLSELERDPKVAECLNKRRLALLSREWIVEPASDAAADQAAAELVRSELERIGYDRLTGYLHDALMKGVAFVEPIWRIEQQVCVDDLVHVEPYLFNFIPQPEPDDLLSNRFGVRLVSPGNPQPGDKIPPRKMIVFRSAAHYSNPWGVGLAGKLFWPVYFKRQGIQFWLAFAERFGTPVPWGRYPTNATPDQKGTLRQALRAFSQEGAIMTPIGMEVELLEAARSGIDTYDRLVEYFDRAIAGVLLGKAGGKESGGQLATAVHVENEVRLEQVKGDADLIDSAVNAQLVRWIVDLNLPGAGYPLVHRVVEESDDIAVRATAVKTLADAGWQADQQYIDDYFGVGFTRSQTKPTVEPSFAAAVGTQPLPGKQPDLSGMQAIDAASQRPAEALDQQIAGLLDAPIAAVMGAATFEDMLTALDSSLAHQNPDALAQGIQRATFAARLLGRSDAER